MLSYHTMNNRFTIQVPRSEVDFTSDTVCEARGMTFRRWSIVNVGPVGAWRQNPAYLADPTNLELVIL